MDGDLRSKFRTRLPGHWQSVESAAVAQGIPDSNYCIRGAEGWVEFKQTHGWVVRFRPTQPGWIVTRARAGGRIWIATRRWRVDSDPRIDELWMTPGEHVVRLATMGLDKCRDWSTVMPRGSRNWDWSVVESLLTRPAS